MNNLEKSKSIKEILESLLKEEKKSVSIYELINLLNKNSIYILLIIFAIPNLLPIPGLSTIIGIPMIIFAIQILYGSSKPILPNFIINKQINFENFRNAIGKILPVLSKVESFSKKRVGLFTNIIGEKIACIFILLFALTITLPIIFGNTLPSIGIILISIGLINKDGVMVIFGIITGVIGIALASLVALLGVEIIDFLIKKIF